MSDGTRKMMFEYPRATPEGEQMGFVEVIELNDDGLIQYHKVYWGMAWLCCAGEERISARSRIKVARRRPSEPHSREKCD